MTEEEASNSADWQAAEKRELESLSRLRVFSLVPRREGMRVIETKWVRSIKPAEKAQGDPAHKARLVAKGFQQVFGTNYFDIWAPTTSINTIRLLASLAASSHQLIYHFDVRTAFLNAPLKETNIYVEPPKGYFPPDQVFHLHRALYGLKQSGREWYLTLSKVFIQLGFTQSKSEPCF